MVVRVVAVPGEGTAHARRTGTRRAGQEWRQESRSVSRSEGGDLFGWLRGLVWSLGPVAPGVAIAPGDAVHATIDPGATCTVAVAVRNRQAASVCAVFGPSALRSDQGVVWLPAVIGRSGVTVPASEQRLVELTIEAPLELPPGTYRGSLVALGMVGGDPELIVEVRG